MECGEQRKLGHTLLEYTIQHIIYKKLNLWSFQKAAIQWLAICFNFFVCVCPISSYLRIRFAWLLLSCVVSASKFTCHCAVCRSIPNTTICCCFLVRINAQTHAAIQCHLFWTAHCRVSVDGSISDSHLLQFCCYITMGFLVSFALFWICSETTFFMCIFNFLWCSTWTCLFLTTHIVQIFGALIFWSYGPAGLWSVQWLLCTAGKSVAQHSLTQLNIAWHIVAFATWCFDPVVMGNARIAIPVQASDMLLILLAHFRMFDVNDESRQSALHQPWKANLLGGQHPCPQTAKKKGVNFHNSKQIADPSKVSDFLSLHSSLSQYFFSWVGLTLQSYFRGSHK